MFVCFSFSWLLLWFPLNKILNSEWNLFPLQMGIHFLILILLLFFFSLSLSTNPNGIFFYLHDREKVSIPWDEFQVVRKIFRYIIELNRQLWVWWIDETFPSSSSRLSHGNHDTRERYKGDDRVRKKRQHSDTEIFLTIES